MFFVLYFLLLVFPILVYKLYLAMRCSIKSVSQCVHRCDVSNICRTETTFAFCPPYLFMVWRRHLAMWILLPLKMSSLKTCAHIDIPIRFQTLVQEMHVISVRLHYLANLYGLLFDHNDQMFSLLTTLSIVMTTINTVETCCCCLWRWRSCTCYRSCCHVCNRTL